jgi:hypothetical protein
LIELNQDFNNREKAKETLLHFASAELTSHASNIIGLALILFSYLNIVFGSGYFERVSTVSLMQTPLAGLLVKSSLDYIIIFLVFWLINSGILFQLMRLVYYGRWSHYIIVCTENVDTVNELRNVVQRKAAEDKRRFFLVPVQWFAEGVSEHSIGFWFSLIVSFVYSSILFYVFFLF